MNKQHQLTEEGLKNIQDELDDLKNVKRPQVIEALKEARAQGDLSENAEYDAARDEQAKVENRIKELELIIKNAQIISGDKDKSSRDKVSVGRKVSIKYLDGALEGKEVTFVVVGTLEADPMDKELMKISTESPIGNAVNGRKKGDEVTLVLKGKEAKIKILDVK